MNADTAPIPGPWLVRGEVDPAASAVQRLLGVKPAKPDRSGGWSYLIRQEQPAEPGDPPLPIATGIQCLADARLMAAAPELVDTLFRLLASPGLMRRSLDPQTRAVIIVAWDLLVYAAPRLEMRIPISQPAYPACLFVPGRAGLERARTG